MKKPVSYFYLEFGELFRAIRVAHKYTQGDIARFMGLSVAYVSGVENAKRRPFSGYDIHKLRTHIPTLFINELCICAKNCRIAEIEDEYRCVI